MTTRLVLAPSAPSQASEFGACPSVCFHGWKWSLTKTDSNPVSSASTENSSNSCGPNCSADALYPSFSTVCGSCGSNGPRRLSPACGRDDRAPGSDLGQHVHAEAAHRGDDLAGIGPVEAEIDPGDTEFLERAKIADDRRVVAREQAAVAIVGLLGDSGAALGHAIGERDFLRVAAGVAAIAVQPLDTALEALQRIEPEGGVGADRIPAVAQLGAAPQRRVALAAAPDRHALLNRPRLKEDVREIDVFAAERGVFIGPQLAAGEQVFVGDRTALGERVGSDRLEFLAAPAGADAERGAV